MSNELLSKDLCNEKQNTEYDLNSVKLVIWDLDEAFWHGTLSDNNSTIQPNLNNIKLVKLLTDKGIINSICSNRFIIFSSNYKIPFVITI